MLSSKVGIAVLLVLLLSVGAGAYGAWDEAPEAVTLDDLDAIIANLEASVQRAEANSSAHPDFLADLRQYVEDLKDWRQAMADGSAPSSDDPDAEAFKDGLLFWVDFDRGQYDRRFDLVRSIVGDGELEIGSASIERGGPGNGFVLSYTGADMEAIRLNLDSISPRSLTAALWFQAESWGERSYGRLITDDDDTMRLFLTERFSGYNTNSIVVEFDSFVATTEAHSVQLNTWHHVALVWERGQVKVYIDGRLQELRRYSGKNEDLEFAADMPLRIGNNVDGARQFFGSFDEIMLWDRALSANEIRELIR